MAPVDVAVRVEGDLAGLPAAVEVAVYRIVQEALNNARRHARATRVRVEVARTAEAEPGGGELRVRIADDGIGLPARPRAGVGMSSMRERAAELGGSCTVTAPDIGGTVVEARFPLTA